MHKITVEFVDCDVPAISSRLSLRELRLLEPTERAKALQRLFLSIEDYLRFNDIGSFEVQLALVAAGAQGFVDDNSRVPVEASSIATMEFFKGVVGMMTNMGLREAELSMLYAGASATLRTHGSKLTCEVLDTLRKESSS
jgi:hypothetical protein